MKKLTVILYFALIICFCCAGCGDDDTGPSQCDQFADVFCAQLQTCGQLQTEFSECLKTYGRECGEFCSSDESPQSGDVQLCRDSIASLDCGDLLLRTSDELCPNLKCQNIWAGPSSKYFGDYMPLDMPNCTDGEDDVIIGGRVETRLARGPGIREEKLIEYTHGLQRYYEPYDLIFYTKSDSRSINLSYIMYATEQDIRSALESAGIPLDGDLTDSQMVQAQEIVDQLMFRDFRNFMASYISSGNHVDIAIIEDIVSPDLYDFLPMIIFGMGVSPALIERLEEEEPGVALEFQQQLGLPTNFSPFIFIGNNAVMDYLSNYDTVIAHEMGHALGLPHLEDQGNLMQSTIETAEGSIEFCRPKITNAQVDILVGVSMMLQSDDCLETFIWAYKQMVINIINARGDLAR